MTLPEDITIIPGPTEPYLNERQRVDYREHREEYLTWLYVLGKEPDEAKGYAHATVKNTAGRLDRFYRWVWDRDGYTTRPSHTHADDYLMELAADETSTSNKAKYLKALKRLYKWRHHVRGDNPWEPQLHFSDNGTATQPRDYITRKERPQIREAALEYGSIPSYNAVTPEERSRWKAYLAQRYGKPKEEVSVADWDRANGWKIPSLVWTSLDAGLRPIEVERASIRWVDVENGLLRIPREDSSKNKDHWKVSLRDRTASALERWMDERPNYANYANTDALWLTRDGNPYSSGTLRDVLHKLCEIADIPTDNRSMSWYSLRNSVGTYMTREDGLAAARDQLRHKSKRTTMRYDQTPTEERKEALERMG